MTSTRYKVLIFVDANGPDLIDVAKSLVDDLDASVRSSISVVLRNKSKRQLSFLFGSKIGYELRFDNEISISRFEIDRRINYRYFLFLRRPSDIVKYISIFTNFLEMNEEFGSVFISGKTAFDIFVRADQRADFYTESSRRFPDNEPSVIQLHDVDYFRNYIDAILMKSTFLKSLTSDIIIKDSFDDVIDNIYTKGSCMILVDCNKNNLYNKFKYLKLKIIYAKNILIRFINRK